MHAPIQLKYRSQSKYLQVSPSLSLYGTTKTNGAHLLYHIPPSLFPQLCSGKLPAGRRRASAAAAAMLAAPQLSFAPLAGAVIGLAPKGCKKHTEPMRGIPQQAFGSEKLRRAGHTRGYRADAVVCDKDICDESTS